MSTERAPLKVLLRGEQSGGAATDTGVWDRCGPLRPNDDQTDEQGTATMKTTTTFLSVGGVMQGIGANGAIADGSRYGLAIEG